MAEIIFTFPKDHTKPVTIAVDGVKGSLCADLTRTVERALGKTINDTPTHEMHEEPLEEQSRLRQGT